MIVNESRGDLLVQALSPARHDSPFEESETPELGSLPRDRFSLGRLSGMASQRGRSNLYPTNRSFTTGLELQIFSRVFLPFSMWLLHFVD